MTTHRFTVRIPDTRRGRTGEEGILECAFSVADVADARAPRAVEVTYGPAEDGDTVVLRRHGGRLFAEWNGTRDWYHGPQQERGAEVDVFREVHCGQAAVVSALMPPRVFHRQRTGTIAGDQPSVEVQRRADRLLFVDGRLHRAVEEPVWHVAFHGHTGATWLRSEIRVTERPPLHPVLDFAMDRLDRAQEMAERRARRGRGCRTATPIGAVRILDPAFVPTYDPLMALARAHGDDLLRKLEPHLPDLDRDCVIAFADMADGYVALDTAGREAAVRFCEGMSRLYGTLSRDRRAVPSDLRNWMREKAPMIAERMAFELEAEPAPALPGP